MSLIPDVILVPYGTDSWSVQAFNVQRFSYGAVRLGAPFPCAAINKINKKPLRLNSEAFSVAPNFNAPQGASPLAFVSDHLKSFCRSWDKLSLRFLDGYFEHIANMVDGHRDEITTKLAPFAGLYAMEDWAFSAPKPLPRAHLYAPRDRGAPWNTNDFVQVDFAFWLGERMVAALSQPGSLTPLKARERLPGSNKRGWLLFTLRQSIWRKTRRFCSAASSEISVLCSKARAPFPSAPSVRKILANSDLSCSASDARIGCCATPLMEYFV